jgi:carbamoyltransferase
MPATKEARRPSGPSSRESTLVVGVSGARRNASVAAASDGQLLAVCEQERVTRVRGIPLQPGALPAEALAAVLELSGYRSASDVQRFVIAEHDIALPLDLPQEQFDHHFAHAAAAAFSSPFDDTAVLVCDRSPNAHTTVWSARGGSLVRQKWPASAVGFASLYSECADVFDLVSGQEHQLEALARLDGTEDERRFDAVIGYRDGALWAHDSWKGILADWLADGSGDPLRHRGRVAAEFQHHLGRLLLALVADIRKGGARRLCLGGGLFYNTYFNTLVRESGIFDDVFVAPNPGNAGTAVGAAIAASDGSERRPAVSPFLGPEFSPEDIKRTLDNCKLSYRYLSEAEVTGVVVDALRRGRLVGWFQGRMEWGHRALGNRSILASPLSPYVLENLNVFLKRRQRYRAYGLSVPAESASRFFTGPPASCFMEYEYRLTDGEALRHVVPDGVTALRVQTIAADDTLGRFRSLHEAFEQATGVPVLVNTSFNGFSEPIVCSPRDAVRVFFGTGLDLLVLDRFVLEK